MRLSKLFTKTSKTPPNDETAINAKLLIQAGFIHKEMAGVYAFLPLGKKVLDNIVKIIRTEMDSIGGQEISMTALQNKDLWEKTDRWDDSKVDNWFKSKLAAGGEVGLAITHEEPITNMLRNFISSYKDLPIFPYQFQTKFRNELRPKSGLMRGREFLMKDLYSYSRSEEEHNEFYEKITESYERIFDQLGIGDITYKTMASGGIFTKFSHEFQTLSEVGEDTIFVDKSQRIAINKEVYTKDVIDELGMKKEELEECRAVEVGNIFTLGTRFSEPLGLSFTNEDGKECPVLMGCYGMGPSRIMGLIAEHFSDDKGLVWPRSIAPALVYIARIGDSEPVTALADDVYKIFKKNNVSVLYDDRDLRAGEKFADADLMGIPYRLVISEKTVKSGEFELKRRNSTDVSMLSREEVIKVVGDVSTT